VVRPRRRVAPLRVVGWTQSPPSKISKRRVGAGRLGLARLLGHRPREHRLGSKRPGAAVIGGGEHRAASGVPQTTALRLPARSWKTDRPAPHVGVVEVPVPGRYHVPALVEQLDGPSHRVGLKSTDRTRRRGRVGRGRAARVAAALRRRGFMTGRCSFAFREARANGLTGQLRAALSPLSRLSTPYLQRVWTFVDFRTPICSESAPRFGRRRASPHHLPTRNVLNSRHFGGFAQLDSVSRARSASLSHRCRSMRGTAQRDSRRSRPVGCVPTKRDRHLGRRGGPRELREAVGAVPSRSRGRRWFA